MNLVLSGDLDVDVLKFFRINENLAKTNEALCGEIIELKRFNDYLRNKLDKLEDILYKRFGLIRETSPDSDEIPKPVKTTETWPNLRGRLERGARMTQEQKTEDSVSKERQDYWAGRNAEIEAQKQKVQEEVKSE